MTTHFEAAQSHYLSSPPYFPVISRYNPEYKLQVFADVVSIHKLNAAAPNKLGKGKQKLRTFSDKSRKSMIMFLAKIEATPDLFVTLTYSDDIVQNAYQNMHRDFEAFRKRLERAYPDIKAMWRIEFQTRKSGRYIGEIKPHFHLLVWLPAWLTQAQRESILLDDGAKWRLGWHEITGSNDKEHLRYYGCQVQPIRNRRHAYSYCSKYLAKAELELMDVGRRWGRIGEFEQPIELDTELTTQAYIELKRLLNKYIKTKAIQAHKNQKQILGTLPKPLSHYMKFYNSFRLMRIATGCSVFGLGYMSQSGGIAHSTILAMVRHARDIALDKATRPRSD